MKGRKIVTVLIIINLILVGIIYSLINKENVKNKKQLIKEMSETEYEDYITELNQSHEDYANYIEQSKTKIASAITNMGVETSSQENLETMASNIKSISRDASSISYDNTSSQLTSTNVQGAVDELDTEIDNLKFDSSIRTNVSNSFIAEKDGWIMVTAKCVTGGNCYIDDSNGFRVFFITELNGVLYLPIPVQKGVTYNAFANGSGASISLIKMD